MQRKPSCATTKSMLCTVSKDEWNTKEGTGKSLKNTVHVLWYAKRGTSWAEVTLNSKSIALAVIELCLTEGISQVGSQSEENSVK